MMERALPARGPLQAFERTGILSAVVMRQKVMVSCDGFSPTSVTEGEREVTVTARLENTTGDPVTIRWGATVDGAVVDGFNRVEVPANETIFPTQTFTANFSTEVPNAIGVEQRFGHQQTDTCGTMDVQPAEPEPEFDSGLVYVPSGDCGVAPQAVEPPQGVSLSAMVVNENDQPAAATVEWTWAGEQLATAGVNVSANSQENAEATATINREGDDQVRAEVVNATESVEGLSPRSPAAEPVRAGASNGRRA